MVETALVLTNARILTMDRARPRARSVTLAGGRIVALDAAPPVGARVIACNGRLVLPGFIDVHVHLLAAAAARRALDCSPARVRSIAALQQTLAAAPATADGWVRAVGYGEAALAEARHPTRWDLDAAVPDRPVRLTHRSGHAVVLNSLALARARITSASAEPPGGVIDRRIGDGEPSGLLIDMDGVLERSVPPLPFAELVAGMRALSDHLLRAGVTAVQDLTHRNDAARLCLLERVCTAAGFAPRLLPPATAAGVGGDGPVKLMLPEAAGLDRQVRSEVIQTAVDAHTSGRQLAIHAATVPGLALALAAVAAALTHAPRADHRHRIEHASLCPPELAAQAAALGVVIVSNPAFLAVSGARYRQSVPAGELASLYAVGMLVRAGVPVAAASDAPVTPPAPLASIRGAMRRMDAHGAVLPGETLDLDTALLAVTRVPAFAARAEERLGTIRPGMAADLVLLNGEPGDAAATVVVTVLAGQVAFAAGDAPPAHRGRMEDDGLRASGRDDPVRPAERDR